MIRPGATISGLPDSTPVYTIPADTWLTGHLHFASPYNGMGLTVTMPQNVRDSLRHFFRNPNRGLQLQNLDPSLISVYSLRRKVVNLYW